MVNTDFQRRLADSHQSFGRRSSILQRLHIDFILLMLLMALTATGLLVLYSASGQDITSIKRQLSYFVVAWLGMFMVAQVPTGLYQRWAPLLYLLGLLMLTGVLFFGVGAKGAQRWLDLPLLPRFQPSELMKLALPAAVAWYVGKRIYPPSFKVTVVALLIIALPVMLVLKQPDLGTSILLVMSGLFVLFFAGLKWRYIVTVIASAGASIYPAWYWLLHDYQRQRVLIMFDPESDKLGAGWNIIQSKTAIGSGGWFGKGWQEGTQSQLDFLPETHTDFIIAVIAEEFGFRGVASLLVLYLAIISRCLWISVRGETSFNRIFAGSITMTFFVYLAVNLGMVSGLLPVVGVPLPLISQGGTALVTLMLGFGCIMAIGTQERSIVVQ